MHGGPFHALIEARSGPFSTFCCQKWGCLTGGTHGQPLFPLHPQLALQLGLGVHVELGVDVLRVAADGIFGEVKRLGDVGTGAPLAQKQQHLGLAGGEAVRRSRPVASARKSVGRGFSLVLLEVGEHERERGVAQVEEQHGEREQAEKGRAVVEHAGGNLGECLAFGRISARNCLGIA